MKQTRLFKENLDKQPNLGKPMCCFGTCDFVNKTERNLLQGRFN